jgi:hypothetical protein
MAQEAVMEVRRLQVGPCGYVRFWIGGMMVVLLVAGGTIYSRGCEGLTLKRGGAEGI